MSGTVGGLTLRGQRVVVIGGSSGVGFAVARGALAEGAAVFVGSSSARRVEAAVGELGAGAGGSAVDVRDDGSVRAFFAKSGPVDHLVFTAGDAGPALVPRALGELELAEAGEVFAVRFWGALRAAKYAEPVLAETGSVTLTDGILSKRPRPKLALAGAVSGAIEHLVRGLAVELAPRRVNAVCLGFTLTEDHARKMSATQVKGAVAKQLLHRPGTAEEASEAYLYCMRGTYTTGQVLVVDGGRVLG